MEVLNNSRPRPDATAREIGGPDGPVETTERADHGAPKKEGSPSVVIASAVTARTIGPTELIVALLDCLAVLLKKGG